MISLAKRNTKLFFRDKASVFFSLLSVMIIISLYILFLGDLWVSDYPDKVAAENMMNAWLMAGVLVIASFTTTLGAFGVAIEDRSLKIEKDFLSTPVKRGSIAKGYILSSFFISTLMSLFTFILAEAFILIKGGELLDGLAILKVLGVILITSFMNVAIIQFIVNFIKTSNAFSAFSSIIGTLIGFLTGIYVPIGNLHQSIQNVIRSFPISHAATLTRQIFMEKPMAAIFNGAPASVQTEFQELAGVTFTIFGHQVTPLVSVLYILLTGIVFSLLDIWILSKRKIN